MIYKAQKIESMCEVAIRRGFANCERLRTLANIHMEGRARLLRGDEIYIPPRQERIENGPTETLHTFELEQEFIPRVEFIRELGHGYGHGNPPMPPAEENERGGNFRPELDPVIDTLNISNYVCDRGGNDTVVGNFPRDDDAGFNFHQVGTADPDHFKIQVHAPRIPDSTTEVEVTLYALRPHYYRKKDPSDPKKFTVEHARNYYTRPRNDARKLTVRCKRIGKTKYLRSAYLRLVSSEADKANRPTQFLLVTDYWNEPDAPDHVKFYTEILHQKVEAEAMLRACQRTGKERCGVYKVADINQGQTLHIAVHAVNDGSSTIDEIRETTYRWTRRVFSQLHCRPVLDLVQFRPAPTNILSIANANNATAGRHASGRRANGQPSEMSFTVDGHNVTVPLRRGMSPFDTAFAIMGAIATTPELDGYATDLHVANRENFRPRANRRSVPFDVTVMRPKLQFLGGPREPAEVRNAASNDAPAGNIGGQTLQSISSLFDASNNFPVSTNRNGTLQERALRRTYSVGSCINVYLMGANAIVSGTDGPFDGWSPWGNFQGHVTGVGPAVFMRCQAAGPGVDPMSSSIRRPLVLAHEIGHPLFHAGHVRPPTPLKDAPPAPAAGLARTVEIMDPEVLDDVDAHDMCKHVADGPIRARYELIEFWPTVPILDGTTPPANTTAVARFNRVGGFYNIIKPSGKVPWDPAAADLPETPPQVRRRRAFGTTANAASPSPSPATGALA